MCAASPQVGLLVAAAVCFAALTIPCEGSCAGAGDQEKWHTNNGKHYYLDTDQQVTHDIAKQMCEKLGSKLATCKDSTEYTYIAGLLGEKKVTKVWLGLELGNGNNNNGNNGNGNNGNGNNGNGNNGNGNGNNGNGNGNNGNGNSNPLDARRKRWQWNDGTSSDSFKHWFQYEPSPNDKCMRFQNTQNFIAYKLHGVPCAWKAYLFCERTEPCGYCPGDADDWYEFDNKFYYVPQQDKAITGEEAIQQCRALNARLVKIDSNDVQNYIEQFLVEFDMDSVWIGLLYSGNSENDAREVSERRSNWRWDGGDPLHPKYFYKWPSHEPERFDKCTSMKRTTIDDEEVFPWFGQSCTCSDTRYNYICERVLPDGWRKSDGRYYMVKKGPVTYPDAKLRCLEMAGTLAVVKSYKLYTSLVDFMREEGVSDAFIGIYNSQPDATYNSVEERRSTWQAEGDSPLDPQGYQDWAENQPNQNQHYARIRIIESDIFGWDSKWYGTTESESFGFICEYACQYHVYAAYDTGSTADRQRSSATRLFASMSSIVIFSLTTLCIYCRLTIWP